MTSGPGGCAEVRWGPTRRRPSCSSTPGASGAAPTSFCHPRKRHQLHLKARPFWLHADGFDGVTGRAMLGFDGGNLRLQAGLEALFLRLEGGDVLLRSPDVLRLLHGAAHAAC